MIKHLIYIGAGGDEIDENMTALFKKEQALSFEILQDIKLLKTPIYQHTAISMNKMFG
jgi:hypothetical protein